MSQWLGRFWDYEKDGALHIIFVGGRKSIGGSFVRSLVGKDQKFRAEVQYADPVRVQPSLNNLSSQLLPTVAIGSIMKDEFSLVVDKVKVIVHLVPVLSDATGYKDESYFLAARKLLGAHWRKGLDLLFFCIDMSGTRLRGSVLRTFEELKPDWSRTVIVLRFADALPALVRQQHHRDNPAFSKARYFDEKLGEWIKELKAVLEHINVQQEVVAKINICPVADEPGDLLPNGEPWLPPLSLAIMEILSPEKKASFLEEHSTLLPTVNAAAELPATLSPTGSRSATTELRTTINVSTRTKTQSSRKGRLRGSSVSPVISNQLQSIRAALSKLRKDCPVFGILVIGRTGIGKSTLINNLLGMEVASVGHTLQSETPDVNQHEVTVEGVQVVVYDTPGLGDVKGEEEEQRHLKDIEDVLAQKKIHLVVCCFQMNDTMMTSSIVGAIHKYHQIGVEWKQSVIALTFADALYVPKRIQALPNFRMSHFFEERLAYWQSELEKELVDIVGVKSVVVAEHTDPVSLDAVEQSRISSCLQKLICCRRGQTSEVGHDAIGVESDVMNICPTSLLPTDELPNGNPWYVPLWLRIVEILSPAATVRFLDIHRNNISDEQAPPPSKHVKLQLQLTKEDKNRACHKCVIRALSKSGIGDLLKLFAPEQTGQSGSEAEQSTSPQNQRQSAKVSVLSQNVYGKCESKESVIHSYSGS